MTNTSSIPGTAPTGDQRAEGGARHKREPEFDAHLVRDISERVYRMRLVAESGDGACERMIEKDGDGGEGLRARSASYDTLTRSYLRATAYAPMLAEIKQCAIELDEAADIFARAQRGGLSMMFRGCAARARAALAKEGR